MQNMTIASAPQQDAVAGLIALLGDPGKAKEYLKQIQAASGQIAELRVDLDKRIALAGDADQIVSLKAQAEEMLSQAQGQAMQLVSAANQRGAAVENAALAKAMETKYQAEELLATAQRRAEEVRAETDRLASVVAADQVKIQSMMAEIRGQMDTIAKQRSALSEAQAAAAGAQRRFEDKLEAIQSLAKG